MKKIAFIGQPEYFRFIYDGGIDGFNVKEFGFNFNMSDKDFDELIKFEADYNFFFRGEFFPEGALNRIKGIKIALSSEPFPRKINGKWEYSKDSIKRYSDFRSRIRNKKFDYVFHYEESSLPLFKKDGIGISETFVFPVSKKVYKDLGLKKDKELFFLGRSTLHREAFFGHLKHKWNFLHIAHGIYDGREFNKLANESLINLNIHAENEISWEPRLQILLASGAFVISEKITPNKYLVPGEDFIEVSTPEEIFKAVEYYLGNTKKRETIQRNARKKVEKYFDSDIVFKEFLKNIEEGKFRRFESRKKGSRVFNLIERLVR